MGFLEEKKGRFKAKWDFWNKKIGNLTRDEVFIFELFEKNGAFQDKENGDFEGEISLFLTNYNFKNRLWRKVGTFNEIF